MAEKEKLIARARSMMRKLIKTGTITEEAVKEKNLYKDVNKRMQLVPMNKAILMTAKCIQTRCEGSGLRRIAKTIENLILKFKSDFARIMELHEPEKALKIKLSDRFVDLAEIDQLMNAFMMRI